jgi:hypothetical protein
MNQLAGFVILLFAALLLIVSSVAVKVIAQGNGSSSEKPAAAAKTCSPEQFKEQPGFCAAIAALAHNKESAASAEKPAAEKPVENLNLFSGAHNKESSTSATIINAPIEVKEGSTIKNKPCGLQNDLLEGRGFHFPNGTITCVSKSGLSKPVLPEKLEIKKPATSTNPVLENCLQTTTGSGKSLCLTTNKEPEKPVSEHPFVPCKGQAGTHNGIASYYIGREGVNGKCVPVLEPGKAQGSLPPGATIVQRFCNGVPC